MTDITRRIENEVGCDNLTNILGKQLLPTDLQSLNLAVYRMQAERKNPKKVFEDYSSNRFFRPSGLDPRLLIEWDKIALDYLPKNFEPIELSPVCPLGTVSCLAPVNQDWILSTVRNSEAVSDTTNLLALECAFRRRKLTLSDPKNATIISLASSQRVTRAQKYKSNRELPHFRLFSLCSAGRDTGNHTFETKSLSGHLAFYTKSIKEFLGKDTQIALNIETKDADVDAWLVSFIESFEKRGELSLGKKRTLKGDYYSSFRFQIILIRDNKQVELSDGGDTDWTQKFLTNTKERLLISGIGAERLCQMRSKSAD